MSNLNWGFHFDELAAGWQSPDRPDLVNLKINRWSKMDHESMTLSSDSFMFDSIPVSTNSLGFHAMNFREDKTIPSLRKFKERYFFSKTIIPIS